MLKISFYRVAVAALSSALMTGCHGYSVTGGPGRTVAPPLSVTVVQPQALLHVNSVFLPPVRYSASFLRNAASANSADNDLLAAWRRESGVELVSASEAHARPSQSGDWSDAAQARGCDSMLETEVNELTERVGSDMGAERPASATISFRLLQLPSRKEIWTAMYTARDQAVTDNLFRLGEKLKDGDALKFHSAKELLEAGFEAAARDLAARRHASFTGEGAHLPGSATAPAPQRSRR